jgi:hypothetical protein
MTKTFFVKFGNIWKRILYWDQRSIEYQNQVQNPSNDHNKIEFGCYIMMGSCMYLMALVDSKFFKLNTMFGYRPFWIQKDHGVNVLRLLMAIVLEVCEKSFLNNVMFMFEQFFFIIAFINSFNHYQSFHCCSL